MKSCSKCGEVKPLDMFYKNSGCVGGYRHDCKSCANKARKIARSRDIDTTREYGRKYAKEWISRNAEKTKMYGYAKLDKKKIRDNDLDLDFCINEMKKPCIYCGFTDNPCNGLDRIDNSVGHIKENCVPCCQLCNVTRMDNYSHQEFLEYMAPGIVALRKSRGEI